MKEKRKIEIPFFPVGDSQKVERVFWKVYAWSAHSVKVGTLFCHQVGQMWSHRVVFFWLRVANREIYNLGMVSVPVVLLKIKGKSWILIFVGSINENKK